MCNYYHRVRAKHAFEYCMNKRFIFSNAYKVCACSGNENPIIPKVLYKCLYYTAQIEIPEAIKLISNKVNKTKSLQVIGLKIYKNILIF